MQTINDLRERQSRIVAEARSRLDEINAATDDSRVSELEAQHDAAMEEYDQLERSIEREERMAALEVQLEERRQQRRPGGDGSACGVETRDGDQPDYRNVFARVICGEDPSDLNPEERAVLQRGFDTRAQVGSSNSAGGYTVPTELYGEIIKTMKLWGPLYDENVCTVMQTPGGGEIALPTVDDTTNEAGAHTEGAALTDDGGADVSFGQKTLGAYSFDTEFIKWSFELDADSIFSMEALLGSLLGERMGRIANRRLTTGTGSNQPNGIVTAAGAGVTSVATSAITFDEIIDLEHSVDPAYRFSPKCAYMFNDATLKAVRKLKDGDGNYLWQNGNVKDGVPSMFNGRPYHINQHMADLGAGNAVMLFGDFGKYFVRKVGSPVVAVLRERFWPQLGIAGVIRFDGELGDAAAVKKLTCAAS